MAGAMGNSPDHVESAAGVLLGHAHYNIAQVDVALISGYASLYADEQSPLNECNVQDMFATTMAAARFPCKPGDRRRRYYGRRGHQPCISWSLLAALSKTCDRDGNERPGLVSLALRLSAPSLSSFLLLFRGTATRQ